MGWDSHKLPWDKMTQQKFPMNKIGNSFILQTIEQNSKAKLYGRHFSFCLLAVKILFVLGILVLVCKVTTFKLKI